VQQSRANRSKCRSGGVEIGSSGGGESTVEAVLEAAEGGVSSEEGQSTAVVANQRPRQRLGEPGVVELRRSQGSHQLGGAKRRS
jgi:hypothetical protein